MPLSQSGTVSVNHANARADATKITAGQLASAMRKAGYDVTAADLKPFAPEWHHAGWRPKGGMGRCYFFRASDLEPASMARLAEQVAEAKAATAMPRYGFATAFRRVRGKYQPVADVRAFAPGEPMPRKYEAITAEQYAALQPHHGADLEPYESLSAFIGRVL